MLPLIFVYVALDAMVDRLEFPPPSWFVQAEYAQQHFDHIPRDADAEKVAFIREYVSGVDESTYPQF